MKKIRKKLFFILFCLALAFLFICISSNTYAATPKLVKTLTDAFEDIED